MIVSRAIRYLDQRLGSATFIKHALRKVFPDHWSFMLGEIALYAFLFLLASGTYLTLFFSAADRRVVYHGSYAPLDGRTVPESYASVLHLSFDVHLGLFMRQAHHWAALLFTGAILFHMSRVFFTGAFRKPRELNWIVGLTLFLLAMADGFTGYSLPGDLLSGVGLRIAYAVAESIPFVGQWLAYWYFGGLFPSEVMTARLFITHVLFVPLALIAAISMHLGMVWRQKHTQFAGPGRTEENVVGSYVWPYYALKSVGLMFATFAMIAFLAGVFEINPVWIYGPFDPWKVASPAQPDWYVAWLDGALRVGPALAVHVFGHTIPPPFWPGILLPLVLFGALYCWPFIEASFSKRDVAAHNLLDKPYDAPLRTGLGVAVIAFGTVLGFAASDDVQAKVLHVPLEILLRAYQAAALVAPVVLGLVAVAICRELQARLGSEPGVRHLRRAELVRNAEGGYEAEREPTNVP